MHDVLSRRFEEYKLQKDLSFSILPDLILIDGGPVQLEFAHNAMKEMGFDVVRLCVLVISVRSDWRSAEEDCDERLS